MEKAIRLSTLAKQFGWQYSMSALQRRLMGEEIELPEPSEPAASAEASEWRRYQAWAFEQRPASLKMKRQANLLARSVWYNKDPARAAAKALTLLALQENWESHRGAHRPGNGPSPGGTVKRRPDVRQHGLPDADRGTR